MDFLKDLVAIDCLTLVDGKIVVKPDSRYSYTTFPIKLGDKVLQLSIEEYLGLRIKMYQFTKDLSGIEPFEFLLNSSCERQPLDMYPAETIRAAVKELTEMLEAKNV